MSVRTMARVWADSKHAGSELLMLLAIADFADDDGNAYPAVGTLAAKCRMKTRNANYVLRALTAGGELQVNANAGPRGTNRYRIVLSALGLQPVAGVQCSAPLQSSVATPAIHGIEPLHPVADEPSMNHQEPKREQRPAPKRRIPENWSPSKNLVAWAKKERPDLNLVTVTADFLDYHLSKGEARASWDASFRTWVRKEGTFARNTTQRRVGAMQSGFRELNYSESLE